MGEACARDERIVGVTVGGSAATASMDDYSDLDFVVVCRDGSGGDVLAEAPAFAGSLGRLLVSFTGEHVGEPRLLICLFDAPLRDVDLKFVELGDLAARAENGVIVWERDGLVSASYSGSDPLWPRAGGQWMEDRFWVWVHYSAAKIGRGELFEAIDALNVLRAQVLGPLLAEANGHEARGVRRIEECGPAAVERLEATVPAYSASGCLGALHATIAFYTELRDETDVPVERHAAALAYLQGVSEQKGAA